MTIALLATDQYFAPLAGLTPTWVVHVDATTGSAASQPTITDLTGGSYSFEPVSNAVGILDLGGTAVPRYMVFSGQLSDLFVFAAFDEYGDPLAGLVPVWSNLVGMDAVAVTQPDIDELSGGLYKTELLEDHVTGAIDLTATAWPRYYHYDSEALNTGGVVTLIDPSPTVDADIAATRAIARYTPVSFTVDNPTDTSYGIWIKFRNEDRGFMVFDSVVGFLPPFTHVLSTFSADVMTVLQQGGWQDDIEWIGVAGQADPNILTVRTGGSAGELVAPELLFSDSAGGGVLLVPAIAIATDGLLMIASIRWNNPSADNNFPTPTGWTLIRRDDYNVDEGMATYYRFSSGETADYTLTWPGVGGTVVTSVLVYSGAADPDPLTDSGGDTEGSSTTIDAPSLTSMESGVLVAFLSVDGGAAITEPGSMTEYQFTTTMYAYEELIPAAGVTGTRTFTAAGADRLIVHAFTLKSEIP